MNVHTVEIGYLIGPSMIRRMSCSQRWFTFPQRDKQHHVWHSFQEFVNAPEGTDAYLNVLMSRRYPINGIKQVTLLRNPSRRGYFFLVVVVNLESLYRQDMTVESFTSFTEERLKRCSCTFDRVMADYTGIKLKTLLDWSTRRVDYAVDISFENPELVALYVSLMQRGRIPRDMVLRELYNGSYYLETQHGDVTINFYDKAAQLNKDRFLSDNDRLLREARGLLRVEVQCQGRKLDHIRDLVRKHKLPHHGMKLRTFLNSVIANIIVQDYYDRAIGYQDYYTLQGAEDFLNGQRGRNDMKQRILQFLRLVDQTGSVSEAIDVYRTGCLLDGGKSLVKGSKGTIQNILNQYLPRYGINPVLLPNEHEQVFLPNPMPQPLRIYRHRL